MTGNRDIGSTSNCDSRLPTPNSRFPGFSLIEIFFVVLVIGIMTGIAIPKIRNMKRRAYIGTMVTDLRNLAMDQESWWSITDAYTTNLALLKFIPTPGVTITVTEATPFGWSATAGHVSGLSCAVFFGQATPVPPATIATVTACQ